MLKFYLNDPGYILSDNDVLAFIFYLDDWKLFIDMEIKILTLIVYRKIFSLR